MLTSSLDNIINITDPYPERSCRVTTSLALRPDHHLHIARIALELGTDRASLVRRALVASGLIPGVDGSTSNTEAAGA